LAVDHDVAAGVDSGLLGAGDATSVGVGDVQGEMVLALRIAAVYGVASLGGAAEMRYSRRMLSP
jgi:hypothetical protein